MSGTSSTRQRSSPDRILGQAPKTEAETEHCLPDDLHLKQGRTARTAGVEAPMLLMKQR